MLSLAGLIMKLIKMLTSSSTKDYPSCGGTDCVPLVVATREKYEGEEV